LDASSSVSVVIPARDETAVSSCPFFILPGRWSGSPLEIDVENGSSLLDFSFKKGRSYFCVLPVRTTGGRVVQSFKLDDDDEHVNPEDAAIVIESLPS
jgi:hypothetical protein